MTTRTYEALNDEVIAFYNDGAFDQAYDLLTREGEQFPEEAPQVLYLRSCLAARIGQPDLAIAILQDALDRGLWYGEHVLRASPSWQPLQGVPAFEHLVTISMARQEAARNAPRLFTQEPAGGCAADHPCPLLLALHGNGDNGRAALNGWRSAVEEGWLLAAVQSSQAGWSDAYIWDDQETALRELAEQYAVLSTQYAVDPGRALLAGFSMGGETALRAALGGTIPVRGFLLLGPGGPTIDTPDAWLPLIAQGAARGLRGVIFMGEDDDTIPQDAIRTLVDLLNTHGIPCELEMLPGLRHAYPADFGPTVRRALAFVLPPA
jgi:predicted esterase